MDEAKLSDLEEKTMDEAKLSDLEARVRALEDLVSRLLYPMASPARSLGDLAREKGFAEVPRDRR